MRARAALLALLIGLPLSSTVWAAEGREVESLSLLGDPRLAVPLAQLASEFAREAGTSVSESFEDSTEQKKKIEAGEACDLLITREPETIAALQVKGMIDVYSTGEIASDAAASLHFTAAVVAGENMDAARRFLKYLKSPAAWAVFRRNGLSAP